MVLDQDFTDNLCNKCVGTLVIHEIHLDGTIIIRQAPNVITYDARTILAYLLAGATLASKYVKFLRVGSDNVTPQRTDLDLGAELDSIDVTYTFPAVDRVIFEGILPNSTPANGSTLREAGLFNADNQMFSRQSHGDIEKTAAIQLKYIWTIIFT